MSPEHEKSRLLGALADGPVSVEDAHRLGIQRLQARVHQLRRDGTQIETVRQEAGSMTVYRLVR